MSIENSLIEQHPELLTYLTDMYAAAQRSKVTKKKMGSIIVGNIDGKVWQILSDGCNGVPSGHDHVFEHDGKTLPNVIHAEDNAIRKVKQLVACGAINLRKNSDTPIYKKIVLFVMSSPCMNCAELIRGSGFITDVVYVDRYRDQSSIQFLKNHGISVSKISGDSCLDLMEYADLIKNNLMVSYLQDNFMVALKKALDPKQPIDALTNIRRIEHTGEIVFDCGELFRSKDLMLGEETAVALRYMLLSVAGVLSTRYDITETYLNPPRQFDSVSNFASMFVSKPHWSEIQGFRYWVDIVFNISVPNNVIEILCSDDDSRVFTYKVGLIYVHLDSNDQQTKLKLTPNVLIVLIPVT